jgi:hypothetical protein
MKVSVRCVSLFVVSSFSKNAAATSKFRGFSEFCFIVFFVFLLWQAKSKAFPGFGSQRMEKRYGKHGGTHAAFNNPSCE